jgi:hypothetical protein
MLNLKNLTLHIRTNNRSQFIDGIHLENEILYHMSQLNTFNFHITTHIITSDIQYRQSLDDIQRTFNKWKFGEVKCCVDYFPDDTGQCHIYSVPYKFPYILDVTNSFRGHLFKCVRQLKLSDQRPFEHDFFYWVANAFSNLKYLMVTNRIPQERKRSNDITNDQHAFPIIHYPKLVRLNLGLAHIDYVYQFLCDENTRISVPLSLKVDYEHLVTVTNNFACEVTRANCSKVETLKTDKSFVYPESVYLYFPLL